MAGTGMSHCIENWIVIHEASVNVSGFENVTSTVAMKPMKGVTATTDKTCSNQRIMPLSLR